MIFFFHNVIYKKLSQSKNAEIIFKEFFRKVIHLCSALIPLFSKYFYTATIIALFIITLLYIICEFFRLKGIKIPVISRVTSFAARERDKDKFVLGPVTLSIGIIITLLMFNHINASIGIFALAFGDGFASLIGKCFGKKKLYFVKDKTIEGSVSCFISVFISTFFVTDNLLKSIAVGTVAFLSEALPLKDFDNVLIPIVCAFCSKILSPF